MKFEFTAKIGCPPKLEQFMMFPLRFRIPKFLYFKVGRWQQFDPGFESRLLIHCIAFMILFARIFWMVLYVDFANRFVLSAVK